MGTMDESRNISAAKKLKVGDHVRIIEHMSLGETRKKGLLYSFTKGVVAGVYPSFINVRGDSGYIESVSFYDIFSGAANVVKYEKEEVLFNETESFDKEPSKVC